MKILFEFYLGEPIRARGWKLARSVASCALAAQLVFASPLLAAVADASRRKSWPTGAFLL